MDEEGGAEQGGFYKGQTGGAGGTDSKPKLSHKSLVPVTLKQIQMAPQDPMEDKLLIDGREVTQVRVVGQVQEMSVSNAEIAYTFQLDDGTAHTEVRLWLHDDPTGAPDYHHAVKDQWRQGIYVEVFGNIKILSSKEPKRTIMASRIHIVKDFNLVTHHFLQCIHAHLFAAKGGNLGHHVQQVIGGIQKFDPYSFGNTAAPTKVDPAHNPYNNSSSHMETAGDLSQKIQAFCKTAPPRGFNLQNIKEHLPGYTDDAIQQSINQMLITGDLYTALDNHYRA